MRKSILANDLPGGLGWLPFLLIGVIAVFFGLVASLGSPLISFLIAAFFLAVFLIASPLALMWVVIVGGLVLAGVSELYLPDLRQARWGVVIAAVGLSGVALLSGLWERNVVTNPLPRVWSPIATWAILFFATATFSAVVNLGMSFDTIVGLKGYFQVWGLLLAFALLPLRPASAERSMSFLFWLGLLQIPFLLQQHFILVPKRLGLADAARGVVAQDILVGTFSGSMTGGGAGPAMAVLVLVAFALAISMWRIGKLSSMRLAAVLATFLCIFALSENKIALVLLPVGLYIVFGDRVRQKPLRAIWIAIVSAFLVGALFVGFTMLPHAGSSRSPTLDEYWEESWSYNLGGRGYGNAVLNRSTVYPFWLKYHQTQGGSFVSTLIGRGPGSSKSAIGGLAEHSLAAERFSGYGIGLTGLAGLLWDVGVLGTLAVIGLFLSAYRMARNLVRRTAYGTARWANLVGAQAGIAMIAISFLHNNMFLYEVGFQTMTMVLFGYIIYVQRTLTPIATVRNRSNA